MDTQELRHTDQPGEPADLEANGFYVKDVEYRSGIVAHQSPLNMGLVAAVAGRVVPPDAASEFYYCDLGCGDGTTVNALAECYPQGRFWGIDFNAAHIETARSVADALGLTNVNFINASFASVTLTELPDLDFIGMNGIYAWLEQPEVMAVHRLLREKLKPGGLFYVEYTSLPGKVSVQPLWSLVQNLVPRDKYKDSLERARAALDLTELLAKRGMTYLASHRPAAVGAQSYIRGRRTDPYREDHFAHNAMASGFRPRYFTEMYDEMASAGLRYAGRCELKLNEIQFSVQPAQVPTFQDYKNDVKIVELLKDYIRNEQQRHDIFVKMDNEDPSAADAWIDGHLCLLSRMPPANIQRSISTVGKHRIPFRGPAFEALIDASDTGVVSPVSVAETSGIAIEKVRNAAVRLFATHQFFLCVSPIDQEMADTFDLESFSIPGKMNRRMLQLSCDNLTRVSLTSPLTGGVAIEVTPLEAILLNASLENGGEKRTITERAMAMLAEEERLLTTSSGQKKGNKISLEELDEVLSAMVRRKMVNMLRLGMITP